MAKARAKQYFLNRISKARFEEDIEAMQEYQRLLEKCDIIPNETFEIWENQGNNTLHSVNGYKIPKKSTKPRKTTQKVYYALGAPIDRITEKAVGIVTESNNLHGTAYKEYLTWIPNSQIIKQDNKIYISAWIVSENNIWDFINKKDSIKI